MGDFREIELAINDLDTQAEEARIRDVLKGLIGIHAARLLQGGVHISYNPLGITAEEIIDAVRRCGLTVDTWQVTGQA